MGGRGSGRRSSYCGKEETNDSMPLDIRKIVRKGLLVPSISFSWQWTVNDQKVAGISIRVDFSHGMVLSYRLKSAGEVVEQRVQTQPQPATWAGSALGLPAHSAVNGWRCYTHRAGTSPAANVVGWAMPRRKKARATAHPPEPTSFASGSAGRLAF